MSGFVYIWYDKKHKKFYIGSHWGLEDDGYICSSNNMRENHRNRPQDFKRRIISKISTSRQNLLVEEQRWLDMIPKEDFGIRYYNINGKANQRFWWMNEETKKRVGEKISKSNQGKLLGNKNGFKEGHTPWNKDQKFPGLINSGSFQKGNIPWVKGKKCPQISKSKKGKRFSEEHKINLSNSHKNKIPWNKGKKLSNKYKETLSKAHIGQIAWNKGKTFKGRPSKQMETYHYLGQQ